MTEQDLIDFENDIAETYRCGEIHGPIHLRNGNEIQLLKIFDFVKEEDYIFTTWANHLHALLKGVPSTQVKNRILEGESMAMNFPKYKLYTSAIVGGISPISMGVAWSIKRKQLSNHVWCFLGDMASQAGISHESIKYSINFDLPINWVIEDNNKSVCTITDLAWNDSINYWIDVYQSLILKRECKHCTLQHYHFECSWPHSGTGEFVSF